MSKSHYSAEFRQRAIKLVAISPEKSIADVASALEIPIGTLNSWLSRERAKAPAGDALGEANKELLRLREENRRQAKRISRLEEEKEILKKAEAFFAEKEETR